MTIHSELDTASTTAVQAKQMGLVPRADALVTAAANELARHGASLQPSTCEVLRGFMVMAMLTKMEA